jgi:NADH-quinone oxidoreductase subunit M
MVCLYLSVKAPGETLVHSFSILDMSNQLLFIKGSILHPNSGVLIAGISPRVLAFWLLFIGFAIKVPVVPLHTWLPDAHVEAATPISAVLAGILLKVGSYGLMRIPFQIFPEQVQQFAWILGLLGAPLASQYVSAVQGNVLS